MAKIPLTSGFQLIPEGSHVFQIVKVDYDEDFGKMEVTMLTQDGLQHIERFFLLKKDGSGLPNDGAMNAFAYFAHVALNDFSVQEIDEQDLKGCFMRCVVEHEQVESNRTAGKMVTFVRLADKEPADGFDDIDIPWDDKPAPKPAAKKQSSIDLNALLGK